MGRLVGKVALIIGSATGIGRATAEAMAREGAAVMLGDLYADVAEMAAAAIRATGGLARAVALDVADEAETAAAVSATLEVFGGLDILHNNAAAISPAFVKSDGDVLSQDTAVWDRIMAVNLKGPMLASKHAIPAMRARGGGSIIITGSVKADLGDTTQTAYATSKGGLATLTRYIAAQYGQDGIRCNLIAPGLIRTHHVAFMPPGAVAPFERSTPLRHPGMPKDVAELAVYLASDESRYVTGQAIAIDGGMTSHQPYAHYEAHTG